MLYAIARFFCERIGPCQVTGPYLLPIASAPSALEPRNETRKFQVFGFSAQWLDSCTTLEGGHDQRLSFPLPPDPLLGIATATLPV